MWKRALNPFNAVKLFLPVQTARSQYSTAIPSPILFECSGVTSVTCIRPFTATREEDAVTAQAILNLWGSDYGRILPKNIHRSRIPGWSHLIQAANSSLGPALQTHTPGIWVCWHQSIHPVSKGEQSAISSEVQHTHFLSLLCAYSHGASAFPWCIMNSEGRKSPVSSRANNTFWYRLVFVFVFVLLWYLRLHTPNFWCWGS